MSELDTIRLVAGREVQERLRGRAYWVMTGLTTLLVVLAIIIPSLVKSSTKPTVVGLVGSAQSLGPAVAAVAHGAKLDVKLVDVADIQTADADLRAGTLAVAVQTSGASATLTVHKSIGSAIDAILRVVLDEANQHRILSASGVSPSTIAAAQSPVALTTTVLNPTPPKQAGRDVAAIVSAILLWITMGVYGGVIANGVAQEKTSRTAEVLLASLRPRQLLEGKVLGIGACGLLQYTITVAAGLVANALAKRAEIPSTVWGLLPAILLFFVLGYALFSFMFAAAGALVSRQEEVQLVTAPFTVVLVLSYLITYAAIGAPDALWLRLISYVPPLTPVLMPARIALGHVAPWEVPLAVVVMVASIVGVSRLAARIYSAALVRTGARVSWLVMLRQQR